MNIQAINNFLRKNKTIFERIRKIENIKDSRLRSWAVDGFCLEFKIDKFDVYYEINRLIKNLKNSYFDKIDLETLLDKTDISEEELIAITELSATGSLYIKDKETLDIVEVAKEILDLLEIKWEEENLENFKIFRMIRG